MELRFSKKFVRQLKKYDGDEKLMQLLAKKIKHVQSVSASSAISELVPIRKTASHYRIKFKISDLTVYRLGLQCYHNTVWFACIEKDKKRFYKQFP